MFIFGKYLNQVSWEEGHTKTKSRLSFSEGNDSSPLMGDAIEHEEPCEGRLSRTVLWEGEGEIPLPDPIVT